MPQRTTPFQAIVHLVRSQVADPNVTVTESKMLFDPQLQDHREVDIVIEGELDGEPITTSLEVIEHKRPAPVTWVEQQIAKHNSLPTNRLVLVSKSGFTKTALTAVAAQGGWVDTIHPTFGELDGDTTIETLYADLVRFQATSYKIGVVRPEGHIQINPVFGDTIVFAEGGSEVGTISQLAQEALNLKWLITRYMIDAHSYPGRDGLKGFSCGIALHTLNYFILDEEIPKYLYLTGLEIFGSFAFQQAPLPLNSGELAGRQFASGEGEIFGSKGVWVRTKDPKSAEAKLSVRFLSSNPIIAKTDERSEMLFPELLDLPEPTDLSVKFEQLEDEGTVGVAP